MSYHSRLKLDMRQLKRVLVWSYYLLERIVPNVNQNLSRV